MRLNKLFNKTAIAIFLLLLSVNTLVKAQISGPTEAPLGSTQYYSEDNEGCADHNIDWKVTNGEIVDEGYDYIQVKWTREGIGIISNNCWSSHNYEVKVSSENKDTSAIYGPQRVYVGETSIYTESETYCNEVGIGWRVTDLGEILDYDEYGAKIRWTKPGIAYVSNDCFNHTYDVEVVFVIPYTLKYDAAGNRIIRMQEIYLKSEQGESFIERETNAVIKEKLPEESMEDYLAGNNVKIYPNPTRGELAVKFDNFSPNEKIRVKLFDVNGNLILDDKVTNSYHPIDINNQPAGNYILQLSQGNFKKSYKIIKQ